MPQYYCYDVAERAVSELARSLPHLTISTDLMAQMLPKLAILANPPVFASPFYEVIIMQMGFRVPRLFVSPSSLFSHTFRQFPTRSLPHYRFIENGWVKIRPSFRGRVSISYYASSSFSCRVPPLLLISQLLR